MLFFPGLSPSDQTKLDSTARKLGDAGRDIEALFQPKPGDFPASLTAYDSSSGYYSWTRQLFDANKARYTDPAGRSGTHTWHPARTPNGEVLDVPTNVWLRPVGETSTLGMVHEVINAASGFTPSLVESAEGSEASGLAFSSGSIVTPLYSTTFAEAGWYILTFPIEGRVNVPAAVPVTWQALLRFYYTGTIVLHVYDQGHVLAVARGIPDLTVSTAVHFQHSIALTAEVTAAGSTMYFDLYSEFCPATTTLDLFHPTNGILKAVRIGE